MDVVAFQIDESRLPVVVVRWPSSWRSMADCQTALAEMATCCRHGAISFVIDVRASATPSQEERGLIAAFLRDLQARGAEVDGFGVVSSSRTARGVMLAVNWLARRAYRLEPFADVEAAVLWARNQRR